MSDCAPILVQRLLTMLVLSLEFSYSVLTAQVYDTSTSLEELKNPFQHVVQQVKLVFLRLSAQE